MGCASFLRVDSTNDFRVVSERLLSVEGTLKIFLRNGRESATYMFSSHALDNNACVLVDEHVRLMARCVHTPSYECD